MSKEQINAKMIFNEERDLTSIEYSNLCNKVNTGALPAEYFRKNLFNATTRESKELTRNKTIYDDGSYKIKVNRSLHQRHRDLLSLLFTDNISVGKPLRDGSYSIHTSLYDLSKKMGYSPKQGINVVGKFLQDLQSTIMVIDDGKIEYKHTLLGDSAFDKYDTKEYLVKIPPQTAKFHILNYSVEIPKEINRKIIAIPNNLAKIKALVSYMLSNQALKNGIRFDNICDKLDISVGSRKSEFLKEIRSNLVLLQEFNITFNEETKIFKYEQIETIKFHAPVSIKKIVEYVNLDKEPNQEELKEEVYKTPSLFGEEDLREDLNINEERYKKLIMSFINSKITINNIEYIFTNLSRNHNGQIVLYLKDLINHDDNINLQATSQFTTYFLVFNEYFKEFV